MCEACLTNNAKSKAVGESVLKIDPTRTLSLRRKFVADVDRRFTALKRLITVSVVQNDCFGLLESSNSLRLQGAAEPEQFKFLTLPKKIDAFMAWLHEQEKAGVLELSTKPGVFKSGDNPWTNTYIDSAYQRGIRRGRQELRNQGVDIPDFGDKQLRDPVMVAFNQPVHAERVALIYTRAYNDLKGITNAMDTQISRILAQGLAEGRGPRELARQMADRVEGIGITRARILARTEVIAAHHAANIQEYRNAGIEGVSVRAEWATAGYKVCPICSALQGKVYSLDEIEFMIPRHPNCRCVAIPIVV
jgi:SPP1 gp7 family putative phage head morphogenesis protein